MSVRERIVLLEELVSEFQGQGRYDKVLEHLEEIQRLKAAFYGADSLELLKTQEKISAVCNQVAMVLLQKQQYLQCI